MKGPPCFNSFGSSWQFAVTHGAIFKRNLLYSEISGPSVLQLGISVMQLLLSMPREASNQVDSFATPSRRQRDVLPLPLSSVGAAMKVVNLFTSSPNGFIIVDLEKLKTIPKQQRKQLLVRACSQIWRFNSTAVLNGQYLGWKGPVFYSWENHTPSQSRAGENERY